MEEQSIGTEIKKVDKYLKTIMKKSEKANNK